MNTNPSAEPNATDEADDLEALRASGDVAALLELAKAARAARDLPRCLAAYRAAADLGSADAEYAVALFALSGGVIPQDPKEGATRLRAAAEKGNLAAKVYLGNLYELGIHYKADPEKADVWYRNAARSAGLAGDPLELAELGCVRYVLAINDDPSTSEADRARLLQRARAHGYGLKLRDAESVAPPAAEATAASAGPVATAGTAAAPAPSAEVAPPPKKRPAGPSQVTLGLSAFGWAILFLVAAVGGGYAAMLGAHQLVLYGRSLPGLGTRFELVFPIAFGIIGVLPTMLVYRFSTVLKALVVGAAVGGAGWVAWGTGRAALHPQQQVQAFVFAIAGFAAALLVLGLLGGTKKAQRRR